MIEYEDFSIKIEPPRDGVYPVIVLRSPAGEGRATMQLPFDPGQVGLLLTGFGLAVRGGGPARSADAGERAGMAPAEIGDRLFQALFSGPVRSLLDRSLGMTDRQTRKGLRLKLHIDPESPSLALVANLPWEYLYDKDRRDFLNLSKFTPIIRYLDVQRPSNPVAVTPPLRVLVVMASPAGYAPLDLDTERRMIEDSWADKPNVEVEFIQRAALSELQDRLSSRPYHVVHYMGHGDFDEETGEGVLMLEDARGQAQVLTGSTLAMLLRDVPTLGLVFLNACESARITRQDSLDPFAGLAAAMVLAGVPAVVAMQFAISDRAAIAFAERFYPLLATGKAVDLAVAEGRRAIRLIESRGAEWGTPVLFMRVPTGDVFTILPQARVTPADTPGEHQPAVAQRLQDEPPIAPPTPATKAGSGQGKTTLSKLAGRPTSGDTKAEAKPPASTETTTTKTPAKKRPAQSTATQSKAKPATAATPKRESPPSAGPAPTSKQPAATQARPAKPPVQSTISRTEPTPTAANPTGGTPTAVKLTTAPERPGDAQPPVERQQLATAAAPDAFRPEELAALLARYRRGSFYTSPNIPADKLAKARQKCEVPASEPIAGLLENAMGLFGFVDYMLFGGTGIYYFNSNYPGGGQPGPGHVPYREFPGREFRADNFRSRVWLDREHFFDNRFASTHGPSAIVEILNAIRAKIMGH